MVTEAMKLKDAPWKENHDKPRQNIKRQSQHFANKGSYSQTMVFPVVMYVGLRELDHKEESEKVWKC